jgi:proteic killer suppression protein
MIKSFADKETERIFNREVSRRLAPDIQRKVRIKLEILDAAETLQDLRIPPSNRLEKLSGDRQGQHSGSRATSGCLSAFGSTSKRAMTWRSRRIGWRIVWRSKCLLC